MREEGGRRREDGGRRSEDGGIRDERRQIRVSPPLKKGVSLQRRGIF